MLNASSVTHRFGNLTAVQDLDLSVAPGELFCLLGANGAGKTTTINLFLGFLTPHWGTVTVGGIEPSVDPKAARRQLAYISENVALYTHLPGLENIRLFCQMGGRASTTPRSTTCWSFKLTTEQMNRRVSSCSRAAPEGGPAINAREARALPSTSRCRDSIGGSDYDELAPRRRRRHVDDDTTCSRQGLGGTIGTAQAGRMVEVVDAHVGPRPERLYLHHMRSAKNGPPRSRRHDRSLIPLQLTSQRRDRRLLGLLLAIPGLIRCLWATATTWHVDMRRRPPPRPRAVADRDADHPGREPGGTVFVLPPCAPDHGVQAPPTRSRVEAHRQGTPPPGRVPRRHRGALPPPRRRFSSRP